MKHGIGRHNYEIYFIDAIEGKLDSALETELRIFLSQNPDLADEYEQMSEIWLSGIPNDQPNSFRGKRELHQPELPVSEEQLNEMLIAEVEGHSSDEEKKLIEKWATVYPNVEAARKYFQATQLQADDISFEEKAPLKFDASALVTDRKLLIAALAENDITEEMLAKKGIEAGDVNTQNEIALLRKLRLQPQQHVFEAKSGLHRRETKIISFRPAILSFTSAAAAIALIITVVRYSDTSVASKASVLSINPETRLEYSSNQDFNESTSQTASASAEVTNDIHNGAIDVQRTAQPNEEPEIAQRERIDLRKLSTNSSMELAVNQNKKLMLPEPDMRLVHQENASQPGTNGTSKTLNLLDYISQSAAEKLENSYAYHFASKQYNRLSEKRSQAISVESGPEDNKMIIRVGSIEIQRDKRNSAKNTEGLLDRATRAYEKLFR